ncbi:MAG: cob(I)yrinic acid a,c-diamide adenosyltransferase [Candidatus Methanolliviera hydrocarbonicum]|uniref:Cob(I)yrinic acid a,c-diamide adenosyltransferase n=1 Tax=Candidatus Methanolliviera hydrocarbonicum TaxID=2491085 RepID=A0A520KXW0_9EURY|nr:MAG: cob(I)yrinic acid a,c-diamide adenosyltransferase [Candidatus Methanolliviera hydrocarbonicum]
MDLSFWRHHLEGDRILKEDKKVLKEDKKESEKKGFIHVKTGDGQGKTTSALGMALRAVGHGLKVSMIQFMKGGDSRYGEINSSKLLKNFEIKQFGRASFVNKKNPDKIDIEFAQEGLKYAKRVVESGEYDLLILDEINVAIDYGLLSVEELLDVIEKKPEDLELVLTGRYAPKEIIDISDYVSEILDIKHPFKEGVLAREGIEY